MKEFNFKIGDDVVYHGNLVSSQCTAHSKAGSRCKRRCVIGIPFCYTHLLYNNHLRIKKSTIPEAGLGLFAMDPLDSSNHVIFKAGETITKYYGETINLAELNNRYHHKTAPYAIEIIRHKLYEDGALSRGVGATANRKTGSANATLSINTRGKYASLKATKNIYNNQEIFLSYGTAFKMNENNVSHSTNNIRNKK